MYQKNGSNDPEDKVSAFWRSGAGLRPKNFYNTYDYSEFWKGREYENAADRIAVARLIKKIPSPHRIIVDVGGGSGRLAPLYEKDWDHSVILDPSHTQLAVAKKKVERPEKIDFIEGSPESIPLSPGSCDTAICIRTFHYVEDPRKVVQEIGRVLTADGYLILEIPNKVHAKARIMAFFSKQTISSRDSVSRAKENQDILFLNHHPAAIRDILLTEGFEVIDSLSASNFRSPFLKKIVSIKILLMFERMLQSPLAWSLFGPSIYFLARKKK
jgi:ubiquinone/menaquinone biosynthesis C-methylase UbiE